MEPEPFRISRVLMIAVPLLVVAATTWLRPYDLGVSQDVRITVEPAPADQAVDLHMVSVDIRMLSGDQTSWHRTSTRFIGLLRRHLLTWRALSPRRKKVLYERVAKELQ